MHLYQKGTAPMPAPALNGTYPLPGIPDATVTAGWPATAHKLAEMFRNGPVTLAEDIETYGVGADAGPGRIKCVTFADERSAVVLDPRMPSERAEIARAQDYAAGLVMHNAPFDCPSLAINGLFPLPLVDKVTDTLIWARLATPGLTPKTLEACLERYLNLESEPIMNLFRSLGYKTKREGFLNLDVDSSAYLFGAAADAVGTARLEPVIHTAAIDRQLTHPFRHGLSRYEALEMAGERQEHNRWGIEQTIRGLPINMDYLDEFRVKNQANTDRGRAYLRTLGVENTNQLTGFLSGIGAIPPDYPMTAGGKDGKNKKLSATAENLEALKHPVAQVWTAVAQAEKLDGYLQKCVDESGVDGRIHPTTAVLKAAHGRDSMAGIPLHQFPELARPIVGFDEDGTSTDWSQQEPRLAMNLAGDIGRPLLDYEQSGIKIYKGIADFADISMDMAKIVVLAGLYGEGKGKLSNDLGLPPDPWIPEEVWSNGKVREARWGYGAAGEIQEAVFSAIPYVKQFMDDGKRIARDHQLAYTMSGRIVPIPSGWYKGKYSVQAHKWINFCVSGSANDEISRTIVLARRAGFGHLLWFGMHDELIHATRVSREVRQLMEMPSERFCLLSGRFPVIRTDQALLGSHWRKV